MPWSLIIPPTRTIYILGDPPDRLCSFRPWPEGRPGRRSQVVIATPRLSNITDDGERRDKGSDFAIDRPAPLPVSASLNAAESGSITSCVSP